MNFIRTRSVRAHIRIFSGVNSMRPSLCTREAHNIALDMALMCPSQLVLRSSNEAIFQSNMASAEINMKRDLSNSLTNDDEKDADETTTQHVSDLWATKRARVRSLLPEFAADGRSVAKANERVACLSCTL